MTLFLIFLWMIDLYIDGVGVLIKRGLIYRVGEFCKLSLLEREMDMYKILLKDVMMDVNSKVTLVCIHCSTIIICKKNKRSLW